MNANTPAFGARTLLGDSRNGPTGNWIPCRLSPFHTLWEFHQSTHKRKSNWEVISYFCTFGTTSKVFWVLTWGPSEPHLQKKNKETNKQISSVVNKKVQTSRSSAGANRTQNSGLVKFASESRWPFVHTSRTIYWNCLELVSTMALKKWNTNFRLEWSDFSMTLKNSFGKCLLFVLSANGWKDQNMDSSFSRQRKP